MCSSIFVRQPLTRGSVHNYPQSLPCLQDISVHLGRVVSLAILLIESEAVGYVEIPELYEGKLERQNRSHVRVILSGHDMEAESVGLLTLS